MTGEADARRQRALMATDAEWERIGRGGGGGGDGPLALPGAPGADGGRAGFGGAAPGGARDAGAVAAGGAEGCARRATVRHGTMPATRWTSGSGARGVLERLTDPGAANRWKAVGGSPEEE